ncbi:DNA primase family protein [Lysinibacillus cavernae]|uniref:DNA primase family protein n=1 Tax=Lysinibacillus cavernae TaxID=2666135 RepID=UPI0018C310A3|nr:phage/plasmid primase, P4 family [Lysinibacillus cavernae]
MSKNDIFNNYRPENITMRRVNPELNKSNDTTNIFAEYEQAINPSDIDKLFLDITHKNNDNKEYLHSLSTIQTNTDINELFSNITHKGNDNKEYLHSLSTIQTNNKTVKSNYKNAHLPANKIAELIISEFSFVIINNLPHYWDNKKSYYIALSSERADNFIRRNIPPNLKSQINSRLIHEIYRWILSDTSIIVDSSKDLKKKQKLIAFKNGIFHIKKQKLLSHDQKYFITSVINADYIKKETKGTYFIKFIDDISKNDSALATRLQELFGYVISEVRNIKIIPFLLGPKDSGKSIILKLLEYMIGPKYYTSISIDQLNRPEYLAELYGMKLNTCAEMQEISLSRLDIIKKLTGGDSLTAKPLYNQPFKFINSAALIFAGNSLPKIKGTDNYNAFSKRIEIFPFLNTIPKEKQDPQLFEKLVKEIDFIAQWAVQGFIRWKNNNFNFTNTNLIDDTLLQFERNSNSCQAFINDECILSNNKKIFSSDLYTAYKAYCEKYSLIPTSQFEMQKLLTTQFNIKKTKFRMNNENRNGYIGITLIDYYEGEDNNGV